MVMSKILPGTDETLKRPLSYGQAPGKCWDKEEPEKIKRMLSLLLKKFMPKNNFPIFLAPDNYTTGFTLVGM